MDVISDNKGNNNDCYLAIQFLNSHTGFLMPQLNCG